MKKINAKDYRVDGRIKLDKIPTKVDLGLNEDELKDELKDVRKDLGEFQDTQYAHDSYATLVCLQGMDTSGKDSLIREVFKQFNSRGVEVTSFKVPTELELSHDYLWRHYLKLPQRGMFGVWNRTHYENVLVTRVHPEYIMAEKIPGVTSVDDVDKAFWDSRFEQIRNFERHLVQNGTVVCKFYLHLSKEEQKRRLLRRLDKPEKNWKFSAGDLKERKLWEEYMECYEDAIERTSTDDAPWFIVPADDKPTARLIVASILKDVMTNKKDITEPTLSEKDQAKLEEYRAQLEGE